MTLPPPEFEIFVMSSAAGAPTMLAITMLPLVVLVALSVATRVSRGSIAAPIPPSATILSPVARISAPAPASASLMAPVEISVTLPVVWIRSTAVSPTTCK